MFAAEFALSLACFIAVRLVAARRYAPDDPWLWSTPPSVDAWQYRKVRAVTGFLR